MLASTASWNVQNPDPSTEISPYTNARLREVVAPDFAPRPKLLAPLRVLRLETNPNPNPNPNPKPNPNPNPNPNTLTLDPT